MILAGAHAAPRSCARFRPEAEAIARLQHPNIVQIYEVGEHERPALLLARILHRRQPRQRARRHAAARRRRPRARRDSGPGGAGRPRPGRSCTATSSPPTSCSTDDGTPKITDFGLAKKLDEVGQTATGAIMGTPSYMAPEQAGGQEHGLGPAADVYALGAILYECLTGRPPFRAPSLRDTILRCS